MILVFINDKLYIIWNSTLCTLEITIVQWKKIELLCCLHDAVQNKKLIMVICAVIVLPRFDEIHFLSFIVWPRSNVLADGSFSNLVPSQ